MRDGRELVLVTLRSTTLTEGWLDGNGLIQLWELEADGRWRLHWTFPEPSDDGGMRVLHYPHGGELFPHAHPEGDLFRFADSASLSTAADENVYSSPGGSVGVLLLRDVLEPPDYLYDHDVSSGGNPWRFPRAATKGDDGTILVTDSGCIASNSCPYPPRLVWISDRAAWDSSRLGYWTPDHLQLDLIDQASAVVRTLECGLVSPFMSQGVPIEQWGQELKALMTEGGRPCP